MSTFEIYWLTRASNFHDVSQVFMVISVIITFVSTLAFFVRYSISLKDGDDEESRKYRSLLKKTSKISGAFSIIFILLYSLIPSTKEVTLIYAIPKITQNETVKQIPEDLNDLYKLGIKELKEMIEEKEH
jgi:uncharacterized membrane protein